MNTKVQEQDEADGLTVTVLVEDTADRAFDVFTNAMGQWWPRPYTWSGNDLDTITIEPFVGGRWYERDCKGAEAVWGHVIEWDRPRRLALTWQIGPDRKPVPDAAEASEVELLFEAQGTLTTLVTLEHRGFRRHGIDVAADYRRAMASEEGWSMIFARYNEAVARAD